MALTYKDLTSTTRPKTWQQQLDEMNKKEYGVPPELQKLYEQQSGALSERLGMQEKAMKQAMQNRLGITGLGGSGVGINAMSQLEQQLGQQKESAFKELQGQQLQSTMAASEAARGREFTAMQAEEDRGIQRDTLNFQKALGLGYKDESGKWIRGSSEIANIELDESLRNDVINAIQALMKVKPGNIINMAPILKGTYGEERVNDFINAAGQQAYRSIPKTLR